MNAHTIYFSSILREDPRFLAAAERLSFALLSHDIPYSYIVNTRDIWVRDFMPVKTKSGTFVSFRYEPSYHETIEEQEERTSYKHDISYRLPLPKIKYSEINLDGGNVVFSPSKDRVIISDRVFEENPECTEPELIQELEALLEARVIIIPSDEEEYTGHADGMVRFVGEDTAVGNRVDVDGELEQDIKDVLAEYGIDVIDFPYYFDPENPDNMSAIGCYINYLETDEFILFPTFGIPSDENAVIEAKSVFSKTKKKKEVIPVNIREIAECGGALNCISWEL